MSEAQDTLLLAQMEAEHLRQEDPDHPAAEWLTAYHAGELPAEKAAELQAHLAVCRVCTRALRDLPGFYQEAEKRAKDELPDALPIAPWLPLDRRKEDLGPPPNVRERRWLHLPTSGLVSLLSAGLFGCLVGFPLGIATHPKAPARPLVVATAQSEVTRGPGEEKPFTLPTPGPAGSSRVLVLQLPDRSDLPASYRVEIQNLAGTTLLSAETAPTVLATPPGSRSAGPGTPRSLAVELPLKGIEPGDYRLLLTGLPEGERLDRRPLRIRAENPRL